MIREWPAVAALLFTALPGFAAVQPVTQCVNCSDRAATLRLPPGVLSAGSIPSLVVGRPIYTAAATQFQATFANVPAGTFDVVNKSYVAWSADLDAPFNPAGFAAQAFSTFSPALPANAQSIYWRKVNWVLNHKNDPNTSWSGNTWAVQQVIWRLLRGSYLQRGTQPEIPLPQPASDDLFHAAFANGDSFVPGPGDVIGVLLYVDGIGGGALDIVFELNMPDCGAKIGDFVWNDINGNGRQDPGEPGIDGVTVGIADMQNRLLALTTTSTFMGQAGYYQFTNLACGGTYQVGVDPASGPLQGKVLTAVGAATPDLDSNSNPTTVTIPPAGQDQTIDFGFRSPVVCTGSIGDRVFNDADADGIQDNGELGIGGVRVLLTGPGNLSSFSITNGLGDYSFTGLCSGTYQVSIDPASLPPGVAPSPANAPGSTPLTDSNPIPATVFLPADNTVDHSVDFGYYPVCTSAIGNFVFTDLNGDGIQGQGEEGINGVVVRLLGPANNVLASTTTQQFNGANGWYRFSGLCAGNYTVQVDPASVPAGFTPSPSNAPGSTPANDSNGSPAAVTVPQNTVNDTVDFGFVPPCTGKFGDFIFADANANGIQDGGDSPISGATVYLRRASDNSLVATTTSNAGPGPNYQFTGVCAGNYRVEVVPPPNAISSPTGQGTPATDSGPNPAPVSLPANNSADVTIDFGFYYPPTSTCVAIAAIQGVTIAPVTLTPTGGAGAPYTFASTNLPAGLAISPTGTISGTPTVSGTFNYSVTITDKNGNIGTLNCSVTIAPRVTANCASIAAVQGVPIVPVALMPTGGAGAPYTFASIGLPAGLAISPTGTISGTPTVSGTFNYTVTITDKNGNIGTVNCSVTVKPPIGANCISINAVQGMPITPVQLVAAGGFGGPYTFSATGLPLGVAMAANGTISGTPTVSGTYNYVVTIVDAAGFRGTVNCTLFVAPPPLALACPASQGTVGIPYSSALVATGGYPPYLYSIFSGALPGGLRLDTATGAITGTPTAYGTFTFVGRVVDNRGAQAGSLTRSCTIEIAPNLVTFTIGGWGASPSGNNPGTVLRSGFATVLGGKVVVGGTPYKLEFTNADAVSLFLRTSGGTPAVLTASAVNPIDSAGNTFADQVIALTLNVAFSDAGALPVGLSNYVLRSGPLVGYKVSAVLTLANNVLAGNTSALPPGLSVSRLNDVVDGINNMFNK